VIAQLVTAALTDWDLLVQPVWFWSRNVEDRDRQDIERFVAEEEESRPHRAAAAAAAAAAGGGEGGEAGAAAEADKALRTFLYQVGVDYDLGDRT
jgi:hypothetical protein